MEFEKTLEATEATNASVSERRARARQAVFGTPGDPTLGEIRRAATETLANRGKMDFNKNQPSPTDLDVAREILIAQGWRVEPPIHDGGVNISMAFEPVEGDLWGDEVTEDGPSLITSVSFAQRHDTKDRRRILIRKLESLTASVTRGEFDDILSAD